MQCNDWPITIGGKTYFVERTFDANPAIYCLTEDGQQGGHLTEGPREGIPLEAYLSGSKVQHIVIANAEPTDEPSGEVVVVGDNRYEVLAENGAPCVFTSDGTQFHQVTTRNRIKPEMERPGKPVVMWVTTE